MNHRRISRIFALLLALAMLATMAATAEVVEIEDVLPEYGEGVTIDVGEPELSDDVLDLDLDDALTDVANDEATTELPEEAVEETEEAPATTELVLGVKEEYALDVEAIGGGSNVTFKSSNTKIATVTSKGVVQGVKKGTATVTCTVRGGETVVYEVRVVAAPGSVTLDKSYILLGVRETRTLTPSVPAGSHASFTWVAKNKKIATVSQTGVITGKKAGTTVITVKTHNGKSARVRVKVMAAPESVTLNRSAATLKVGGTLLLKATLSEGASSGITWQTSKPGVATVSANGKVTAVAEGNATITARTYNGKKATCKVTVVSESSGDVVYRALLIGEVAFRPACARNKADVLAMQRMLKNVTGPDGGSYSISKRYDLSAVQVLNAISKTFAGADDDDVSLFFIATHGDVDKDTPKAYAGSLAMTSGGDLLLSDLANALEAVPGKVIVVLESCGAGAAVYANNSAGDRKTLYEEYKQRTEAFDAAVIKAFADADSAALRANTGEFRVKNKFYVLTASRYQELSWGWESGDPETSYNYFTLWLTQGVGVYGDMPADTNRNGRTTLNELYKYISKVGDNYPFSADGKVYYQHVQVYPANSGYTLFCR